jgi:hypothetical protein
MSAITSDLGYTRSFTLPEGSYEPGLRLINGDKPSIVEQAKSGLSTFWGWVTSNTAKAWGWVNKTLHLEAGWNWAKSHLIAPARAAAVKMGVGGAVGSGLLMVSTGFGRKVLHYLVGVPAGWVRAAFSKAWTATEVFFHNHLGAPGTWVADRMDDTEKYLFGPDGISGLVGRVGGFYFRHISKHTSLDSIAMRTLRVFGTGLAGMGLLAVLPLALAGTALGVGTYLVGGAVFISVAYQSYHLGYALGSIPSVAKWLNQTTSATVTNINASAATVAGVNISTLVDDMATATGKGTKDARPAR